MLFPIRFFTLSVYGLFYVESSIITRSEHCEIAIDQALDPRFSFNRYDISSIKRVEYAKSLTIDDEKSFRPTFRELNHLIYPRWLSSISLIIEHVLAIARDPMFD